MPEVVALFAAVVLAVAFGWAALAKLFDYSQWRRALEGYGLPARLTPPTAVVVPVIELSVAGLLLFGPLRAGAALSLAMLGLFSLAIMRARSLQGEKLPCGCFGRTTERDWRLMLIRNSLLALPAALALLSSEDGGIVENASVLRGEVVPVLLVGLALLVAVWLSGEVLSLARKGNARR